MKINVYNKKHIPEIKKQFRDNKGRFSSRVLHITIYTLAIIGILLIAYLSQQKPIIELQTIKETIVIDTTKEIIATEKANILNLLENCESGGNENNINWEDNGTGKNRASFGAYMFKVGTVQLYVKGLTDFQAIELVSNKLESRKLAETIIFETKDGIYNWKNCMLKNNLLSRVNFVVELNSKIK